MAITKNDIKKDKPVPSAHKQEKKISLCFDYLSNTVPIKQVIKGASAKLDMLPNCGHLHVFLENNRLATLMNTSGSSIDEKRSNRKNKTIIFVLSTHTWEWQERKWGFENLNEFPIYEFKNLFLQLLLKLKASKQET